MHKNRSKIDSQLSISTNMCFRNTTNWQIKKLNEKIVWKIIKNQAKLRITIFSILQDELNRNSSVGGEISWTRNRDNSLNTVAILLSRSRNCFRSRVETYVCLTERGDSSSSWWENVVFPTSLSLSCQNQFRRMK